MNVLKKKKKKNNKKFLKYFIHFRISRNSEKTVRHGKKLYLHIIILPLKIIKIITIYFILLFNVGKKKMNILCDICDNKSS